MKGLPLTLPEASQNASQVDFAFLVVFFVAAVIFLGVFLLLVVFSARYRRGSKAIRGPLPKLLRREIEIGWTTATTFLAIFLFWWFVGGSAHPANNLPDQIEIHVVAKQWMWKTQQPDGAREIDTLHIPVNTPIRLVMTSQDVIHSFFVPAFRLKQDVLPVRSTVLAFTATETGAFHLFCAEYCGTQHSHMTGKIVVMTPAAYARWLRRQPHGDTLLEQGELLYAKFGCGACHSESSRVHAPKLVRVYGSVVRLQDGRRIRADDAYLKRSILRPRDDVVSGFDPIMPSYDKFAGPADLDALVAYIKSMPSRRARQ